MKISRLKVVIWPDVGWRIQWKLNTDDPPIDPTYTISIDRSSSPEGPFEEIGSVNINTIVYEDRVMPYRSFFDKLFYRIRVLNSSDEDVLVSPAITTGNKPDRIAYEIIRQHEITLYGRNSHPGFYSRFFACFKRNINGTKCEYCIDKHTGEILIPRCKICNGTRYLEGYANPILYKGRFINQDRAETSVETLGESESERRTIFMAAYPELEPGDIIVEKGTGARWFVDYIDTSRPGGILVSQRANVHRVSREDISNSLNYPGET